MFHENGGKRGVLTQGSLVYAFENESHQFSNVPYQGIVEELDLHAQEVTIRTLEGKILKSVSLCRVYL